MNAPAVYELADWAIEMHLDVREAAALRLLASTFRLTPLGPFEPFEAVDPP